MKILSFARQCTGASCIQHSPTAAVQNSTSFLLMCGPLTVDSLTPQTTRFTESYNSIISMNED